MCCVVGMYYLCEEMVGLLWVVFCCGECICCILVSRFINNQIYCEGVAQVNTFKAPVVEAAVRLR